MIENVDVMVVLLSVKDIILGTMGGMVAYLFDYSRAKRDSEKKEFPFMMSSMIINMALGAFISYIVGSVIPIDTVGRDAIVGLSGVTAYNILLIAESRFATWVVDKITKK